MPDTKLPDAHFGPVTDKPMDWRKMPIDASPDDDEPLPVTPPDVVRLLGFDPAKEQPPGDKP
jgi:hypothetical protein